MQSMREIYEDIERDPTFCLGVEHVNSDGVKILSIIRHLGSNLDRISGIVGLTEDEYWKLRILIAVHDTLKIHSVPGSSIESKYSHASLARSFLSSFTDDEVLLQIVQYHDEPYRLFRSNKELADSDVKALFEKIQNVRLFVLFQIVLSGQKGKSRKPVRQLIEKAKSLSGVEIPFSAIID